MIIQTAQLTKAYRRFEKEEGLLGSPATIIAAVIMIALGLLFMVQLNFLLGIFAFKFQDISFFLMIKGSMVAFIAGSMVPLSLLPDGIQAVMRWFPSSCG